MLSFCVTAVGLLFLPAQFPSSALAAADGIAVAANGTNPAPHRFERYLARAQLLLQRYGYGVVAATVMAEGVGIPAPGQTLLIAGALEAADGRMNIAWLLLLVTTATAVGNSFGYVIGRWGGRAVLNKLKISPSRQQRFYSILNRRGGVVVLLARFVDGLRQLNGIIAGVMDMPWRTFTAYNAAGALLWTGAWGLGTYYFGRDIHVIAALFHRHRSLTYILSAAVVTILLVYLLRSSTKDRGSVPR